MNTPFHYVILSTYCYSTEIYERVLGALLAVGAGDPQADIQVEKKMAQGHFGDQLFVLTARLDTAQTVRDFCIRTLTLIPPEKQTMHIDDNCFFHLRFNKEEAYKGKLELIDSGNIIAARGKIRAYPACRDNAISTLQKTSAYYRNG
jgi:RNA binding exosome subunit